MGEYADYANDGGYDGGGLGEREYVQPKMPKAGTYPTKWKSPVDFREDWTDEEIWKDFLENGIR